MKAVHIPAYVSSYKSLQVASVPSPVPTEQTPIHVRIHYAAINYVDLLYARGKHQNNSAGLVTPPFILGLEFSGVVLAAPPTADRRRNPDGLLPGDEVYGGCSSGAFAEEVSVSAAQVRRMPKGVQGWDLRGAAGIAATAPVAYGALVRCASVKKGETVLVHAAAGGLGVMAVQITQALGANVIATVGSEQKAAFLRQELGVRNVVDYSVDGWEEKVLQMTGGKAKGGVDVVFDTVGMVGKSIRCTKYAGRIIIAGFAGREGDLESVAANRILLKSVSVIGYRYGEHGRRFPDEHATVWRGLDELISQGSIRPIVYHENFRGLGSVPNAMQAIADRSVYGKAIVDVRDDAKTGTKL